MNLFLHERALLVEELLAPLSVLFVVLSIMLGEAMGISQALQWVAELGFDGIDFSLGSKITVDSFNGGSKHNT